MPIAFSQVSPSSKPFFSVSIWNLAAKKKKKMDRRFFKSRFTLFLQSVVHEQLKWEKWKWSVALLYNHKVYFLILLTEKAGWIRYFNGLSK